MKPKSYEDTEPGNCANLLLATVAAFWKLVSKPFISPISFSDFVSLGFTPINGRKESDSIWSFERSFGERMGVVQFIYSNNFLKRLEVRHVYMRSNGEKETFYLCTDFEIDSVNDLKWVINHLTLLRTLNYKV